jgi:hypothetical protein
MISVGEQIQAVKRKGEWIQPKSFGILKGLKEQTELQQLVKVLGGNNTKSTYIIRRRRNKECISRI